MKSLPWLQARSSNELKLEINSMAGVKKIVSITCNNQCVWPVQWQERLARLKIKKEPYAIMHTLIVDQKHQHFILKCCFGKWRTFVTETIVSIPESQEYRWTPFQIKNEHFQNIKMLSENGIPPQIYCPSQVLKQIKNGIDKMVDTYDNRVVKAGHHIFLRILQNQT